MKHMRQDISKQENRAHAGGPQPELPAVAWYTLIDGPLAPSPACHVLTLGKLFKLSGHSFLIYKIGIQRAPAQTADCQIERRYLPG